MTHSNPFDTTKPTDDNYAGDGDDKIIQNQKDLKERLEVEHYMAGVLDTTNPGADGYHKKVTMKPLASTPSIAGAGILFTKTVNSVVELFYNNGSIEYQITNNGILNFAMFETNPAHCAVNWDREDTPLCSYTSSGVTAGTKTFTTNKDVLVLIEWSYGSSTVDNNDASGYIRFKEDGVQKYGLTATKDAGDNWTFTYSPTTIPPYFIVLLKAGKTYTYEYKPWATDNNSMMSYTAVLNFKMWKFLTVGTLTSATITIS